MHGVPVVIMANKQDLPYATSCSNLVKQLDLEKLTRTKNKWFIQSTSALNGDGIYEAMDRLAAMMKENNS
jgi:signal recognition particle receptor subunit beta